MTKIDGKTVAECWAMVDRFGNEIVALQDTLENLLTEKLKAEKSFAQAGNAVSEIRSADSQVINTDSAWSLPIRSKGKGKRNVEGYLGFQISMTGNGINIPGNEEPLLHVFCLDCPVVFEGDDECYIFFPIDKNAEYPCTVISDRLVSWGEPGGSAFGHQWVYSLRLMSINSIADLTEYVVTPAMGLLNGGDVSRFLPDGWLDKVLVRLPATL